jgi:hypothetical protein
MPDNNNGQPCVTCPVRHSSVVQDHFIERMPRWFNANVFKHFVVPSGFQRNGVIQGFLFQATPVRKEVQWKCVQLKYVQLKYVQLKCVQLKYVQLKYVQLKYVQLKYVQLK